MENWIDLSAYEMKLYRVYLPNDVVLVVPKGDQYNKELRELGFIKEQKTGYWANQNATIPSWDRYLQLFPNARISEQDPRNFTRGNPPIPASSPVVSEVEKKADRKSVTDLVAESHYLGLNRLGNMVYRHESGRFIQDRNGRAILEGESQGLGVGLFLRGVDEASLSICAEGFVEEIASNKCLRYEDFRRFANAVTDTDLQNGDPRLMELHLYVESALSRSLSRKASGKSMRDLFFGAVKLHEGHPYIGDLLRHTDVSTSLMPLPISIIAQRVLGVEQELEGKDILISGAGSSSLLMNLPRQSNLHILESGRLQNTQVKQGLLATVRDNSSLKSKIEDVEKFDYSITSTDYGIAESPKTLEGGLTISRSDFIDMANVLEHRNPEGHSVFIFRQDPDDTNTEYLDFKNWIASRHHIEGHASIDSGLYSGLPDGYPLQLLVVGKAKTPNVKDDNAPAIEIKEIADFASLWTWTTQVFANRAKIENYLASQEGQDQESDDPELQENYFQVPYTSASSIGQASTMVPRNLEGSMREALSRVARKHPKIDEWVGNELGMTLKQMEDSFSPEQVDAIALAIDAEDRGRKGTLNADQTGIGKGRFIAAMMLRAVLQGKQALFLTEKGINISDIIRDIRHINAFDNFNILILNSNGVAIDEVTNNVIVKAPKPDVVNEIMKTGKWPEEYNLIISTYSQFSKNGIPNKKSKKKKEAGVVAVVDPNAPVANVVEAQVIEDGVHPKSYWVRNAITENILVVADESHNVASGQSNTSRNCAEAIKNAGHVIFSSATFAKQAKNMDVYAPLFPPDFNTENLTETIRKGGENLQETLSSMLVKDGVMIRREHDLSKCEFQAKQDVKNEDRNQEYMDRLAPILAEMAYLSGELDKRVNNHNQRVEAQLKQRVGDDRKVKNRLKSLQISRMSFGSPLYNMSRLFVASLLVDKAAEEAVEALKNNQKPVILVENTIQSLLQELQNQQNEEEDQANVKAFENGEELINEGERVPDFKDLMKRVLGQLTKIRRNQNGQRIVEDLAVGDPNVDATERLVMDLLKTLPENILHADEERFNDENKRIKYKDVIRKTINTLGDDILKENVFSIDNIGFALERVREIVEQYPDDIRVAALSIRNMFNTLPENPARAVRKIVDMIADLPDLPASAIDAVRDRITEAGFTCEEITGRTLECRDGRIVRRPDKQKVDIKNGFNAGLIDALIINVAGATGIDLHAGSRFIDQRQRKMICLQEPADIVKFLQALGRVNRFDQVIGPIICRLMAGLPIELRLLAMTNQKLRRMSANTSSNRESAISLKDIPDLMNPVGDVVCSRYAEARPELMKQLGFDVDHNLDIEEKNKLNEADGGMGEDNKDNQRSANQFLARIAMLSVAAQKRVLEELEAEYRATVQELDARGENPLKSKTIDGVVHLRERAVIEGTEADNTISAFHEAVFAQKVVIEHKQRPFRGDDVLREYEKGVAAMGNESPLQYSERLKRNKDIMLETYLPAGVNVQEALASPDRYRILNFKNVEIDRMVDVLSNLQPGSSVKFTLDGVVEEGVVVRVMLPDSRRMHLASNYDLRIVAPGFVMPYYLNLKSLLADPGFEVGQGLNGDDYDKILRKFDFSLEGSYLEPRTLLTGNAWMAMSMAIDHKLGSMVSWKGQDGVVNRGILISKGAQQKGLDMLPVSMRTPQMCVDAIRQNQGPKPLVLFGSADLNPTGVMIKRSDRDRNRYVINLPNPKSRKYGYIFENDHVKGMLEQAQIGLNNNEKVSPKISVTGDELSGYIEILMNAGVRFVANSTCRDWANKWMAQNMVVDNDDDVVDMKVKIGS